MGSHIIDGQFQSDKYPWCNRGFVPLKLTDPMAQSLLWKYAEERKAVDEEFGNDLQEALMLVGYVHCETKSLMSGRYILIINKIEVAAITCTRYKHYQVVWIQKMQSKLKLLLHKSDNRYDRSGRLEIMEGTRKEVVESVTCEWLAYLASKKKR